MCTTARRISKSYMIRSPW